MNAPDVETFYVEEHPAHVDDMGEHVPTYYHIVERRGTRPAHHQTVAILNDGEGADDCVRLLNGERAAHAQTRARLAAAEEALRQVCKVTKNSKAWLIADRALATVSPPPTAPTTEIGADDADED